MEKFLRPLYEEEGQDEREEKEEDDDEEEEDDDSGASSDGSSDYSYSSEGSSETECAARAPKRPRHSKHHHHKRHHRHEQKKPAKKQQKKEGSADDCEPVMSKREHDSIVARRPLPIMALVLKNACMRSCGKCKGCQPCGACANCKKNAKNEEERSQRIRQRIASDPDFAKLGQKKQAAIEKKKKKLKCTETVCERVPDSASRIRKQMKQLQEQKKQLEDRLVKAGEAGDSEATEQLAQLIRRMNETAHSGLPEGHSYALRAMKKDNKLMLSFAREVVSRGDQGKTGEQRRLVRDLKIGHIIQTAERFANVLKGSVSDDFWQRTLEDSRQFLSGRTIRAVRRVRFSQPLEIPGAPLMVIGAPAAAAVSDDEYMKSSP